MSNNAPLIEILLTPRFQQDLRKLAKRYRSIRQDLTPLLEQLQQGETPGDLISGNKYQVVKVHLKKRCDPQAYAHCDAPASRPAPFGAVRRKAQGNAHQDKRHPKRKKCWL